MSKRVTYFDVESTVKGNHITDIGAVNSDGAVFHGVQVTEFSAFIKDAEYVCGHNIIHHDIPLVNNLIVEKEINIPAIDTLYLSPLLFPKKPYHRLVKDEKLISDEISNPVNDSIKAKELFEDEVAMFNSLPHNIKRIYFALLNNQREFKYFFKYIGFNELVFRLEECIKDTFKDKICANSNVQTWINNRPIELAYALALIYANDDESITPRWLQYNYPEIENVMQALRNTPCENHCNYCNERLNIYKALGKYFGYSAYRRYNGEPLQENAVSAAVKGQSLLAIFPTGGGKSITFQIPAFMAAEAVKGLTVVISPLQSLMKDQVDNLAKEGITNAVSINGLLTPIERRDALERIENGSANLLYISPEMLRSKTIERILFSRNVVRFVIDEAHCFSSWGQDFRVDYLYIGDFINKLQTKKHLSKPIPVSCFTATAKQKVVADICDYFYKKLGLQLEKYTTNADRENLHYTVLYEETEDSKYATLRNLIEAKNCPTIVYTTRTKRAENIAEKLVKDGFSAKPFHGRMDSSEKIANQESFIKNETQIIVATSAFGMGVDKKDVKLVIHYNISDSLENYVQEAGRAGRDPLIQAECYVLFNNDDLDSHFMLLNQTKLSIGEIQQVWKAIKDLTKTRPNLCCSPLEIARQAGWDNSVDDIETRVKTAVAALENAGYLTRGNNVPHVYATSILAKDMIEASAKVEALKDLNELESNKARAILSMLISSRTIGRGHDDEAESRVDYIADRIGLERFEVVDLINKMRQGGLLADDQDMSVYISKVDTEKQGLNTLDRFRKLEQFILRYIVGKDGEINLKELNEAAQNERIAGVSIKNIRTILYFLSIKNLIKQNENKEKNLVRIELCTDISELENKYQRRNRLSEFAVRYLAGLAQSAEMTEHDEAKVNFSLVGIYNAYLNNSQLDIFGEPSLQDMEDSLLYLSKIGALKLEGGFLILYNAIEINRKEMDNKIRYKLEDYRMLDNFYKLRIQQIHIVGEYANLMVRDYDKALMFVRDYFGMDYKEFISKYFAGSRKFEIERNITPGRHKNLFGTLSAKQREVIDNSESKYILVSAGPGSGKTKLLVHKLASLLLMEDVKHDQLLMLTFSRAAATEFKKRLIQLIGGTAAHLVEIKTFHSYCFDLLGKVGSLENSENVVKDATALINNGEVEPGKITKNVLVIDEAQDMDKDEFELVRALMSINDEMRVIAVGDDDQNIYEFRGSSSEYMALLVKEYGADFYEMTTNYRSKAKIVDFANMFAESFDTRMKKSLIEANTTEEGKVELMYHTADFFEQSVVDSIIQLQNRKNVCVLTNTNDEALRIAGLLNSQGVRAKLIQSNDGFRLYDLLEVRSFVNLIEKLNKEPVISDAVWKTAQEELLRVYGESACLNNVFEMIHQFEEANSERKYVTDLKEFILESHYEDFYADMDDTVFVSTIHKSKGREFETVYLYLRNVSINSDADRRKLYVGFTRAKSNLLIFHNMEYFRRNKYSIAENTRTYDRMGEITIQLTHRDVVLSYFKNKRSVIAKLRSGSRIDFDGTYFLVGNERLAKVSQKMAASLSELAEKGYKPMSAVIRFVMAWKGEEDEEECAVLLPNIILRIR